MTEFSAEIENVIAKAQKLFALGKNNPNEHEASAAIAKGMELLAAHNLDMAVFDGTSKRASNRKDTKLRGGLYSWQRDIWNVVASLNFCRYWFIRGLARGSAYEHRVLGRHENVISTQIMSEYLQETVERLAVEYGKQHYPGKSRFIRPLIAYREGIAARLVDRVWRIKWEREQEDRRKKAEQAGSGGGTALVLADVIQNEEDLNTDYLMGWEPGTAAAKRAERMARQAAATAAANEALAKEKAEWDAFAAAHPEEAARIIAHREAEAKREGAEAKKRSEKYWEKEQRRKKTAREERALSSEFHRGYDKGAEIGLDKQIDKTNVQRIAN